MMKIYVITLFPDMLDSLKSGLLGKAIDQGIISIQTINPRDFSTDKHSAVDDAPYGGGPGMLMQAEPLHQAVEQAKKYLPKAKVVYLSPQGQLFNQKAAIHMAEQEEIILICGRYEGVDQRFIDLDVDEEWSIGDYVLSGGEFAAMVMIDAVSRLVPGVIGDQASITEDSLYNGLLKYPQYTRPELYKNRSVPPVLLSGHHKNIEEWKKKQSLGTTWLKRPDLLAKIALPEKEQAYLAAFISEYDNQRGK
jgi:tRNA (guanine37-N1)-methyltransferase